MTAPAIPGDIVSLADYERHARQRLPADVWAFVAGASADGITRRWNREAFDRLRLQGRVLSDMKGASTRISLFGKEMPSPILLAPVAFQRLVHPDGELAAALGAGALGTWMTVSSQASATIEEIAAGAHAPLWFQLYAQARRDDTLRLVRRVEDAGYGAIALTADAPVSGVRNEEQRAGFRLPAGIEAVNLRGLPAPAVSIAPGESPVFRGLMDAAPRWADVEWLRGLTSLPLLLKGVISPADARRAVEAGIDGIVVSNHGGRTLDTLPASIEALPAIAEATAGRVPLILDGGVRRGTDIVKAIALGASAVMVGQPLMHALAVAGAAGVAHVISILRAELEVAMALTGRPTVGAIDRSILWVSAGI